MRIYIDMDGVLCDFEKAMNESNLDFPQSQYGFFRNLEDIGTVGLLRLAEVHDVYILTAPSIMNPMSYTEKADWIIEHLGRDWLKKLIICYDKSLLKGDMLIDDNAYGRGQDFFEGSFIHFGGRDYQNWDRIVEDFT